MSSSNPSTSAVNETTPLRGDVAARPEPTARISALRASLRGSSAASRSSATSYVSRDSGCSTAHSEVDESSQRFMRSASETGIANYHPPPHTGPVPTYITKNRRNFLLFCAAIIPVLSTGLVFGFSSLKPALLDAGVYHWLCDDSQEVDNDNSESGPDVCKAQLLQLDLMFMLATTAKNAFTLPFGYLMDRLGPRAVAIIGSGLLAAGCVLFGISLMIRVDLFIEGFLLIAVGGPTIFITLLHFSNLVPSRSGLVLAICTSSFDVGSCMFWIFDLLAVHLDLELSWIFIGYAVLVPGFIAVSAAITFPDSQIASQASLTALETRRNMDPVGHVETGNGLLITEEEALEQMAREIEAERAGERQPLLGDMSRQIPTESSAGDINASNGNLADNGPAKQQQHGEQAHHFIRDKAERAYSMVVHHLPATKMTRYAEFWLGALFLGTFMLRINFFIDTVADQMMALLPDQPELADSLARNFALILAAAGLIATYPVGMLLDHAGLINSLLVCWSMGVTFGILIVIPQTWATLLALAVISLMRPLLYTVMADYTAKIFGYSNYGVIYGIIIFLASCMNATQYIFTWYMRNMGGGSVKAVNLLLLFLSMLALAAPVTLLFRTRYFLGRPTFVPLNNGQNSQN
eukprot:Clim_evm4s149 gene=Clim_evmTU4s149